MKITTLGGRFAYAVWCALTILLLQIADVYALSGWHLIAPAVAAIIAFVTQTQVARKERLKPPVDDGGADER